MGSFLLKPTLITPEAWEDMKGNKLESAFAVDWVERYPDLHLCTQTPFAISPHSTVRRSKLIADFAFGTNIQYTSKGNVDLLLAPGVIIELDGSVHRYKWDRDEVKKRLAIDLGFKFFSFSEQTYYGREDAALKDVADAITAILN